MYFYSQHLTVDAFVWAATSTAMKLYMSMEDESGSSYSGQELV
jgi:hypothetical protein